MSRQEILRRIGAILDGSHAQRAARTAARLQGNICGEKMRDGEALTSLFLANLHAVDVDVVRVPVAAALPAAMAEFLTACCLPLRLRRGADERLARLPWQEASGFAVDVGPAEAGDTAGLSWAVAGVAETGTLVLASSAASPATLAFLPDTHLVVITAATIVATYEDACALAGHPGQMPRAVNFITGASRTGDIGGRIVQGAHGPRRLAVFLLDDGGAPAD